MLMLLGSAACTTTLDPTLQPSAASGGSGSAGGGNGGAPTITPRSLDDCGSFSIADHTYRACNALRSFAEATVDCASGQGMLIKVDSPAETDLLKTLSLPSKASAWLGASRDDDLSWSWLDGTRFWQGANDGLAEPGAYVNWQAGEPDNTSDTVREEERCATFEAASAVWVDRYCNLVMPYVCELPSTSALSGGT